MRVETRVVAALVLAVLTIGGANELEAQACDVSSIESLSQGKIPNPISDTSDCTEPRQRSLGSAWAVVIERDPAGSASPLQQLVDYYRKFERKTNLTFFADALYERLKEKGYDLPARGQGYGQLDGLLANLREGKIGQEEQEEPGEEEPRPCPDLAPFIESLRNGRIPVDVNDASSCDKEQQRLLGEAWAEAIEKNPGGSLYSLRDLVAHYRASENVENLGFLGDALYIRLEEKGFSLPPKTGGYGQLDDLLVALSKGSLPKREREVPEDPDGKGSVVNLIQVLILAAVLIAVIVLLVYQFLLPRKSTAMARPVGPPGKRPWPLGAVTSPTTPEVKTGAGAQADNSVDPGNKEKSREIEILKENLGTLLERVATIDQEVALLQKERVDLPVLGRQINELDTRLKKLEQERPSGWKNPPRQPGSDFTAMEQRLKDQLTRQLATEWGSQIEKLGGRIDSLDTSLHRLALQQAAPPAPAAPQGESLELGVFSAALETYDVTRWKRIQCLPEEPVWKKIQDDVLDALPRAVALDEELRVACDTLIAPLKDLNRLASKISRIPTVANNGLGESIPVQKRLLLIRECEHLMYMFQYFGSLLVDKLDFSVEKWAAERFLGFGDLLLRKYQEAEAAGRAAELEEARRIVLDVLRLADLAPVEISLGRTQFDSGQHMGRSTTRRTDLPDGAIVSVVCNGFQRSDGSLWRQPEVIVNRL